MRMQGGEGLNFWALNVTYFALVTFPKTRSARRVSDYANVPRLGLRPSLLLNLAKPQVHAPSDTRRTLLNVIGFVFIA